MLCACKMCVSDSKIKGQNKHTHTQPSPSGMVDQVPLLVAAGNGHTDIVQLLVQHGANVNTQVRSEGVTLIKFLLFFLPPSPSPPFLFQFI